MVDIENCKNRGAPEDGQKTGKSAWGVQAQTGWKSPGQHRTGQLCGR
jgi:hypothetical protein